MSATTVEERATAGDDDGPSLGRLTRVELRKMVNTRAGFWLQLVILVVTVGVILIVALTGSGDDLRLRDMLGAGTAPSAIFLPVVGILLVASEWTQRTALITFALVPRRGRVLLAKVAASVVLSLVAFVLCVAFSVVATAFANPGLSDTWSIPAALLGQDLFNLVVTMTTGVAFGAVFLNTAPAIVAYFVVPTVLAALGTIHALVGVARWIDPSRTLSSISDEVLSTRQWERVGTSLALWLALPLLLGLWRILRSEVR
jgi:ABC-2 type transport system permease protein